MDETKEQNHLNKLAEERNAAKDEKKRIAEQNRRKAYTADTLRYIVTRVAIMAASAVACAAELLAPVIHIPVSLFCLCTACVRLGRYLERSKGNG